METVNSLLRSLDKLVGLLKNHQVGLWCKRAAWLIVLIDLVHLLLDIIPAIANGYNNPFLLFNLLSTVLGYASGALFSFFILYAVGAAIEHLMGARAQISQQQQQADR
jgi:hypothetical protein